MTGLLTLLGVGFLGALLLVAMLMMRRLRHPPRKTYAWAVAKGVPGDPGELDPPRSFETWTLSTRGVSCECWDIMGDDPNAPVIITTPGWGDSKIGVLPRLEALAPFASRVIAWDPPGHADSPGRCPLGTREHELVRAIMDECLPPTHDAGVILMGWSLGGGVSICAAAGDARVRAVIAEAPYRLPWTPAFRVMHNAGLPYRLNGPVAFALLGLRLTGTPRWNGFDRAEHAARLTCPLLVVHGVHDEVCPIDDGRAIARAAGHGLCIELNDAMHNNIWTDDENRTQATGAVRDFLLSVLHTVDESAG